MGVLDRIPREQLGKRYTHRGWLWFCPVYLGALDTDCLDVTARNWVPEWLFDLAASLDQALCWIGSAIDPEFEPSFMFLVTGPIEPEQ